MPTVKVTERGKPTAEGTATQTAAQAATRSARNKAFTVRKTILAEKDGWLVLIRKDGTIYRRVKKLTALVLPAK